MAKKDRKRRYSYNEYRLSVYVEKSFYVILLYHSALTMMISYR